MTILPMFCVFVCFMGCSWQDAAHQIVISEELIEDAIELESGQRIGPFQNRPKVSPIEKS